MQMWYYNNINPGPFCSHIKNKTLRKPVLLRLKINSKILANVQYIVLLNPLLPY